MITISTTERKTAKDEIQEFLDSKAAGHKTTFSATAINNAASTMFTAQGLYCPVRVFVSGGETYIINRDIVDKSNGN